MEEFIIYYLQYYLGVDGYEVDNNIEVEKFKQLKDILDNLTLEEITDFLFFSREK